MMPQRTDRQKAIRKRSSKTLVSKRKELHLSRLTDWNELVPQSNRLTSPNKDARRPTCAMPTHIVIHVTGEESLEKVKAIYLRKKSVSPHYLVTPTGELFQFVRDGGRAWHAGIEQDIRKLYRRGYDQWSQYLRYFDWYKGYPKNAVYLDGNLKPVSQMARAVFVTTNECASWSDFRYFHRRWRGRELPVNFDIDSDPNNYSIGIELLTKGAKRKNKNAYPRKMYRALNALLKNLSEKYGIPRKKGRVIGHEDVNPIGRFGWDPNSGFDWTRVHR